MTEALPTNGAVVVLHDEDGGEHRSQVHSAAEQLLTVHRPTLAPGVPLLKGAEVVVSWSHGDNSVTRVQARIGATRYDGDILLWDLALLAEPVTEQRRQWTRVAATGPITVTELVDELRSLAPGVTAGELLDVSEVALRCVIAANAIWASRRNAGVRASFELAGDPVEVTGRVLTSRLSSADSSRREVVVLFDQPVPSADTVRRYVEAQPAEPRPAAQPVPPVESAG